MRNPLLILLIFFYSLVVSSQETNLSDQFKTLANDLESKYTDRPGIKVAILEFRTSDNKIVPFSNVCSQEMADNLRNSMNFKLMDSNVYAAIAKEKPWSNDAANSYEYMDDLGRIFMEKTGDVPVAYIYGIITDNNQSITITAYLVSLGASEAKSVATINIDATEKTDSLLGKTNNYSK